jgi:hypothetical protein
MGKVRERQIILKTDQRTLLLEMRLGGKFQQKSSAWDENRTFPEGDVLEVERFGRAGPGTASSPALFSDRGVTV